MSNRKVNTGGGAQTGAPIGTNPKHATAGFGAQIPGMTATPTAHTRAVRLQRELDDSGKGFAGVHKEYDELSRTMRVVNRGLKGPMKGKPFLGVADGLHWPDGVHPHDDSTWLQPGEFMDVPKEAAFIMFGNLWDKNRPDRHDIIRKYGNHSFEAPKDEKVSGMAPMIPTGCPPIPDVVVYEVDARGHQVGAIRCVYDIYCRDYAQFYERDIEDTSPVPSASNVIVDPQTGELITKDEIEAATKTLVAPNGDPITTPTE